MREVNEALSASTASQTTSLRARNVAILTPAGLLPEQTFPIAFNGISDLSGQDLVGRDSYRPIL
jgi:hypothetical protein